MVTLLEEHLSITKEFLEMNETTRYYYIAGFVINIFVDATAHRPYKVVHSYLARSMYIPIHVKFKILNFTEGLEMKQIACDVYGTYQMTIYELYLFIASAVSNFFLIASVIQDNQRDLEQAIEILSEYLEHELTDDYVTNIKQKVQDKYEYCEGRRIASVKHVQQGYENDFRNCVERVELCFD
ncbi:hypothetical protein B4U80_02187 [Leptotrombidium deliense]|uniref:Uncharacterized protein n=1 Tax=Leptotrombidium deliense TaxID=299467 RepID=A0A443RYJ2_9ACAR|nr:hypothetical protein B4U80_02187 [Leptotrombidium deliense]